MRPFLFFLIIIISTILLSSEKDNNNKNNKTLTQPETKKENKTINKALNQTQKLKSDNSTSNKTGAKKPKKPKKPKRHVPPSNFTSPSFNQDENVTNKEIYSLNDLTFDMVLQKGNFFKWFVILYSETCGHCEFARRELRKIFAQYKNSTTIRFAEIEINRNPMTNMRFDIEGVPYIFLLQNNSIYEMDLYPNQKNLIKFIATDFKEVEKELKPFPPMVPIYKFGWQIIKNIFNGVTSGVNELLYDNGYEFQFTPHLLLFTIFMVFGGICILEYFCCMRFCPDEDQKKINTKKNKKNEKIEKKEENDKEEEEEEKEEKDNDNDDNDESKENKETTEEEKMEREKQKEKEKEIKMKEKEKKIKKEEDKENKENKQNKEIKDKKQKKKKKE